MGVSVKYIGRLGLGVWAILSVAALAQYLIDAQGAEGVLLGEVQELLAWKILLLNAPIYLLVASLGPVIPVSGPVAEWTVFTLVGFCQWAVLVPGLWAWLSRRHETPSSER